MSKAISDKVVMERIATYVPDPVKRDLEVWAKEEGRKISNLTAFILEKAVTEWRERKQAEGSKG